MTVSFVPANRLYDVESGSTFVHPSRQALDADVREAVESAGGGPA